MKTVSAYGYSPPEIAALPRMAGRFQTYPSAVGVLGRESWACARRTLSADKWERHSGKWPRSAMQKTNSFSDSQSIKSAGKTLFRRSWIIERRVQAASWRRGIPHLSVHGDELLDTSSFPQVSPHQRNPYVGPIRKRSKAE